MASSLHTGGKSSFLFPGAEGIRRLRLFGLCLWFFEQQTKAVGQKKAKQKRAAAAAAARLCDDPVSSLAVDRPSVAKISISLHHQVGPSWILSSSHFRFQQQAAQNHPESRSSDTFIFLCIYF